MTGRAESFEQWIRTSFVEMNTQLEDLYFAQPDRAAVIGRGDPVKAALRDEGRVHVAELLAEGNTGDGFESAFGVLGSVGMYLGSVATPRAHQSGARGAIAVSSRPLYWRCISAHRSVWRRDSPPRTSRLITGHAPAFARALPRFRIESLFSMRTLAGILSLQRVADALGRIVHLGVSSPVADVMFDEAKAALHDVIRFNDRLMRKLDVDRFFYSVRPYYKPYRVGRQEYRGADAADFSGINEIDLLLGVCRANDPYYAQLLVDKAFLHDSWRSTALARVHDPHQPSR